MNHKYILEPYKGLKTRYICPKCKHRSKTYTRYIDKETGNYLHDTVGRCNRENNCAYHYTPKQYFQDNNFLFDKPINKKQLPAPVIKPPSEIPSGLFKSSLKSYESNNFVLFLNNLFGEEISSALISKYYIGTSKHWPGSTVFWQIDLSGKVRTGKIMLYNTSTGKRVKEPFNHITWVHNTLKQDKFNLMQCFFGEHLLKDKSKPVAIVESEKTAIIASVYLPGFLWLAAGSLTNLNTEKCTVLKGRKVILFPDLNAFEKWSNKAKELSILSKFIVSDLLENKASDSDRKHGFDLADYLIKYNSKEFSIPEPDPIIIRPPIVLKQQFEINEDDYYPKEPKIQKTENWDTIIAELENYFASANIPKQPIKLNPFSTILSIPFFIESHLSYVKANNGKRAFLPYLDRLKELKNYLTLISN
jgi:hypothetical protein